MKPQRQQTSRSGSAVFTVRVSRSPPHIGQKLYGRSSCGSMKEESYNLSMSILKVARMGHPVLRERAQSLDRSAFRDPLFQKLIDDMIDTMHEYHGVGLAAPQIHEGLRLFVALLDEEPGPKTEPA